MDTHEQVIAFIKDVKFAYLATLATDGTPRVRPLAACTVYGKGVYFFTYKTTRKVTELASNPAAELVWARPTDNAQVRMRGNVVLVEDNEVGAQFKADNPIVAQMLPPGAEHLFTLYTLEPDVVEAVTGLRPYTQIEW